MHDDPVDNAPAPRARRKRATIGLLIAVVLVSILAGLWRFTDLSEFAEAERVATWLEDIQSSPWAPLLIMGTYLVANAVLFPTLLLNMGVVLALGSVWGFIYAMLGSMVAGLAFYAAGQIWGRAPLQRLNLRRLNKVIAMIQSSGVAGLVVLRLAPVAPYPIVNVALGAAGIRSVTFAMGTAVGLLPSVIAMTAVGRQLQALIDDPSAAQMALLGGVVLAALAGLYAMQRLVRRKLGAVTS